MEQSLLDTSKYRIYSMSIDSRFADNVYGGTEDFMIRLPSTYRNIMRIALSSVEIPAVEFLFSERHGNTTLRVDASGTTGFQTAEIYSGNYDVTDFLTVLKDALNAASPGALFDVRQMRPSASLCITSPYPFTINPTSTNSLIAARPNYWGIGYYLGFRDKGPLVAQYDTDVNLYALCAPAPLLLQPTPYYLLQLQAPDLLENITHRTSAGASVPAFAKLILRDGFYCLQFVDGGDWLRREYTFLAPNTISQLRVKLLDPYGVPVDMRWMDWSMTFELYEVVNTRIYNSLSMTYERP
jgi:hypothetical protein